MCTHWHYLFAACDCPIKSANSRMHTHMLCAQGFDTKLAHFVGKQHGIWFGALAKEARPDRCVSQKGWTVRLCSACEETRPCGAHGPKRRTLKYINLSCTYGNYWLTLFLFVLFRSAGERVKVIGRAQKGTVATHAPSQTSTIPYHHNLRARVHTTARRTRALVHWQASACVDEISRSGGVWYGCYVLSIQDL